MLTIIYPPVFVKKFGKLEISLQEEAFEKIELFKDRKNHQRLEVHKLRGRLKDCFAFSVNYKYRIAFSYISENEVLFLDVDDHDIYKR